jgi:hypothetical protein
LKQPSSINPDFVSKFNRLRQKFGLSPSEALSVLEDRRKLDSVLEEKERFDKAAELQKIEKSRWPNPDSSWDVEAANWYMSMDDHDPPSFAKAFPNLELVWVGLHALIDKLADGSRRLQDPFHERYRTKTAGLVVHLEDGGQVSPPLVIEGGGKLHVVGGNHRLGWAQFKEESLVPILIRGSDRSAIEVLVEFRAPPD